MPAKLPSEIDMDTARKDVGDGPMRFAPIGERSTEEQIAALTTSEKECFDNLKTKWEKEVNAPFTDEMYLRFARCSPGKDKFNEKASWKVMKKFKRRYLALSADDLEDQLSTKVGRSVDVFTLLLMSRLTNIFLIHTTTFSRRSFLSQVCNRRKDMTCFTCVPLVTFPKRLPSQRSLTTWLTA
jgi:hypothetical protein